MARDRHARWGAAATLVAAVAVSGCGGAAASHGHAQRSAHGSVPRVVRGASAASIGLADARRLTVQVWLRPKLTAAERFATAVSTPGNPMYRDFLTPDAYTARFGATAQEASRVGRWLRLRGFGAVSSNTQRDYVAATASAPTIRAAFAAERGRDADASVTSGRGSVAVPSRLAPDVLGLTASAETALPGQGASAQVVEEDAAAPSSGPRDCSGYLGQRTLSGLPEQFGTTTFAETQCSLSGSEYRSAYGASLANTGAGQTIAFDEAGGVVPDMFQTLTDYARRNHLPAPSPSRYKEINQQPASCAKPHGGGEEQMDVEAAYAMAPGATQIVVGADVCQTGSAGRYQPALDADMTIVDGTGHAPLASVVSNSWETGFDDQTTNIDDIETAYLVKAAAVGVGMYYSAGDQDCVTQPASNPYATGVGGTILATGRNGRRVFETGAAFGFEAIKHGAWQAPDYFGYGGGLTRVYRQPSYQKGVVPTSENTAAGDGRTPGACRDGGPLPKAGRSPMRSAPDLGASVGNFTVGLIRDGRYTTIDDGGTSLSAPLVAGMVIAAQQGQSTPFGFINPALYKLAGTSAFYDPKPITARDPLDWRAQVCPVTNQSCGGPTELELIDDQSRSARGYGGQVTATGYDDMTGVGVPNGQAFITAMRNLR